MDFDFIQQLMVLLKSNNIFGFVITGSKTLALILLMFKFLDNIIRSIGDDNQKLNNLPTFIAYAFFIVTSDWIPNLIEETFVSIDVAMSTTSNNVYLTLDNTLLEQWDLMMEGCEDWMDYIGVILSSITFFVFYLIAVLLSAVIKIADMSMTVGYLLTRLFLIELMKVIFPIVIAYSTLDITKDLLGRWIKWYTGLMLLGLAFLGIINFCNLLANALQQQFNISDTYSGGVPLNAYTFGLIITIVVTFMVKVKLFRESWSLINNFFS